jgi:hypothetical protein
MRLIATRWSIIARCWCSVAPVHLEFIAELFELAARDF